MDVTLVEVKVSEESVETGDIFLLRKAHEEIWCMLTLQGNRYKLIHLQNGLSVDRIVDKGSISEVLELLSDYDFAHYPKKHYKMLLAIK